MPENCPYCDAEVEINHDDGSGYDEDRIHEQKCGSCDKYFAFTTSISFYYELSQADCLNGGEHELKLSNTYPKRYARWQCQNCEYSKPQTEEEVRACEVDDAVSFLSNLAAKSRKAEGRDATV